MSVSSWEPDPTGRHQYRWWDGEQWTDQVADNGVQTVDAVTSDEANLPSSALPPAPTQGGNAGQHPGQPVPSMPDITTLLSSRGQRLGAYLIEVVLVIFTLGIGWLVWALIVFSRGQSPAKHLLDMRVVQLTGHQVPGRGFMFLRDILFRVVMPPLLFIFVDIATVFVIL